MPQDKDELLQVLITKYAQMYMKLAYAIGVPYDDVEDIVMEAFWSFYRADYGGKLESEKAIKVMLARIVENKCIDYFRKEKRSIKPFPSPPAHSSLSFYFHCCLRFLILARM